MEEERKTKLMREKRLILIIDLDHTLLHATSGDSRLMPKYKEIFANIPDLHYIKLQENNPNVISLVKIRPFVNEFLTRAKQLFELHVYTHGSRPYANEVVKLIDPKGEFFQGRILSRDESECSFLNYFKYSFLS